MKNETIRVILPRCIKGQRENSPEETSVQTQDRHWLLGLWGLARIVGVRRAGLRECQAAALCKVSSPSGNPLLCS